MGAVKHTTLAMKNLYCAFMNASVPKWESKLIGVCMDGATSMTGRAIGFATQLQNDVESGFIRTWCGSHQVDFAVERGTTFDGSCEDFLLII